jgi:hypothetical protein
MGTIRPEDVARNALVESGGQLLADIVIAALRRPDVMEALRALNAAPAAAPDGELLLSKQRLAKALEVSVATVDRLTREGMPIAAHVGDARRYDLDSCRSWLAARGKRPTRAPKRAADVDIGDVVDGAGLAVRR